MKQRERGEGGRETVLEEQPPERERGREKENGHVGERERERREAPMEEALYTGWILIRLPVSRLYAATSVTSALDQPYP